MQVSIQRLLAILSLCFFQIIILPGFILGADSGGARTENPFQLQASGSNLGVGGEIGIHLASWFYIGAESYSFHEDGEGEQDDKDVEPPKISADFDTAMASVRLSPFSWSGFYFQLGSVSRDWLWTITGKGYLGDDTTNIAEWHAEIEWPITGAYYGVGFNWIADFGLSGGFGGGTIVGGPPKVTKVEVDHPAVSQDDIDKASDELENDLERFNNIPFAHIRIGFNF